MRQAENTVFIEGILSEIDLKYGSFKKNGVDVECIKGNIKVKVMQKINKDDAEPSVLEIPVNMFAPKMTNAGKPNPGYESIERVMNEYKSIAAVGEDHADRIRISKGSIEMNDYWSTPETLVSYPRIRASFVNTVRADELDSKATFNVEFVVGGITPDVDKDGVETGKLKIAAILPQYGGKVDVVEFMANDPNVKDAVSNYWQKGDSVKASGRLDFTSSTISEVIHQDFGEDQVKTRTVNKSELVLTGGSQSPLEGDFAFDMAEINQALANRKAELDARKAKDASRTKQASAPAQGLNSDLGF